MKRVKLTVVGTTGAEYSQIIEVADDYELPPISNQDDWIEIEGLDGTLFAVPPHRVIGIAVEGKLKKAAKGGRVN